MPPSYIDLAETVGRLIAETMLEREKDWEGAVSPDRLVYRVLMAAGLVAIRLILSGLGMRFEQELKDQEYVVERRPTVRWMTLFGVVEVVSPYLRKAGKRVGARPLRTRLGVQGDGKSRAVERALTDFGIDDSFGTAAAKFAEHYGTAVHRTTVRRTVLRIAGRASEFMADKLSTRTDESPRQVMVQADGALVPKVVLERVPGERTPTGRPKLKKTCSYREVRLGLAVPDDADQPTYVAQVGELPRFAAGLAQAAQHRGADEAFTYAVTDGGNGLREQLEHAMPIDQYVLDMGHCRKHLCETADAMGLQEAQRDQCVDQWQEQLVHGEVDAVLAHLNAYAAFEHLPGADRARRLHDHLHRFRDAVSYQKFRDQGLIVGSGEVESAHRHVTQRRLKLPGAWWNEDNLEPILDLRCIRANGWWHEFWEQAA